MEELVWSNNSSMLAGVTNRFPWDSGTMISFQIPASFSGSMPSTAELSCGNVDDNSILGIQQQPDVSYGSVQPNAFAHQHPHHPLNQMTAQAIPRFLDKVAADSVLTSPRSVSTGWGHAVSSSVATNIQLLQSIPEINPDYLHNTNACLGEAGSSPCNDLMQFSYSYDDSQHRNLQSSIGSLHYVVSSDDAIQKDDGISPISTTENNVIGNMNSLVLSASNPPQKSTSTIMSSSVKRHSHSINIIEDYQSTSQGSFNPIIMKSKAVKSKSKPKPKTETFEDNPQLGMQYNYSSPSSSSCLVFGAIDPAGIEPDEEAIASMREMIYSAAALRPVNLGTEVLDKPKRKNVKISSDPQTIAARQRREKISERIRILQRLVPGGTKMDTASMLDEAISYLKFLKTQIKALQSRITSNDKVANSVEINSIAGLCFSTINSLESLSFSSALHSRIYQNPTCGK